MTKVFNFCYGHRLPGYEGKCKNSHGHNSRVEVEFTDPRTFKAYDSMIVDFRDIKNIVGNILEDIDHKNLNEVFEDIFLPPTTENITMWLVDRISRTPLGPGLIRARVSETLDSWVEWKKEGAQCQQD